MQRQMFLFFKDLLEFLCLSTWAKCFSTVDFVCAIGVYDFVQVNCQEFTQLVERTLQAGELLMQRTDIRNYERQINLSNSGLNLPMS